jgi:hypothetical protein
MARVMLQTFADTCLLPLSAQGANGWDRVAVLVYNRSIDVPSNPATALQSSPLLRA